MKLFFPYIGSKYTLSSKYGSPRYETVIEPFAGSAAYSLYYDVPKAILYDVNPYVVEIWEYLISATAEDIMALPLDFETTDEIDAPAGARFLIGSWISIGRSGKPATKGTKWWRDKRDDSTINVWGRPVRERIAGQLNGIRQWQIIYGSYSLAPDIQATWLIDPPYQDRGKYSYMHHYVNYERLASWIRARQGHIILCENSKATWIDGFNFSLRSTTNSFGEVSTERADEVAKIQLQINDEVEVLDPQPTRVRGLRLRSERSTRINAGRLQPDHEIYLLSEANPKRPGSTAFSLWEVYRDGMTVESALAACVAAGFLQDRARSDLAYNVGAGLMHAAPRGSPTPLPGDPAPGDVYDAAPR